MFNEAGLEAMAKRMHELYFSDRRDPNYRTWENVEQSERAFAMREARELIKVYQSK